MSRRRFRLLAVGAGLLVGLGVAEVLVRWLGPPALTPRKVSYHFRRISDDPYLWELPASGSLTIRWDGDPYGTLPPGATMTVGLNAAGLRGPLPEEGRRTVLLVGDSFTFGEGVPDDETFARRTERRLQERLQEPVAVVNAGIPGYGTYEESFRLPDWLDRFRYSAAVVVYVPNDPIPLIASLDHGNDLMKTGDPLAPIRIVDLARRRAADRAAEEWYRSYYFGERRAEWTLARKKLRKMRDDARARGVPFGVALFPLIHRLADRPFADVHDEVARACREMNVPFIDLTPALAAEPDRELWVHPTDHHPNARAHGLVAAPLAAFVERLLK